MTLRQRQPREVDEPHRRFIASCPCVICGASDVQAAHVRFADLSVDKPFTGGATKPDDKFTVPLCVNHHAQQHAWGDERGWWMKYEIDPIKLALALYCVTGNSDRAGAILNSCRIHCAA
jgi:hypothetical protein